MQWDNIVRSIRVVTCIIHVVTWVLPQAVYKAQKAVVEKDDEVIVCCLKTIAESVKGIQAAGARVHGKIQDSRRVVMKGLRFIVSGVEVMHIPVKKGDRPSMLVLFRKNNIIWFLSGLCTIYQWVSNPHDWHVQPVRHLFLNVIYYYKHFLTIVLHTTKYMYLYTIFSNMTFFANPNFMLWKELKVPLLQSIPFQMGSPWVSFERAHQLWGGSQSWQSGKL